MFRYYFIFNTEFHSSRGCCAVIIIACLQVDPAVGAVQVLEVDADVERSRSTRARARAAMQRSCQCAQAYCVLPLLNPNLVCRLLPSFSCKCARLRRIGSPSPPVTLPSPSPSLLPSIPALLPPFLRSPFPFPHSRSRSLHLTHRQVAPAARTASLHFCGSLLSLLLPLLLLLPLHHHLLLRSSCIACLVARNALAI